MFRAFLIRGEVAVEGVDEVRPNIPLSRVGPLANLLRLDGGHRQSVGRRGGQEVAQVGEEARKPRSVTLT